ncbi:DUF2195 family protein [Spartinivicinus ruber]|uniref:DUF2195 family protein n=1 Tax=Spartinivicinus ruber TaxID=2683272 RepID=UPI0013D6D246|nr:DUF2195 family protein [Spartinivicinus ruber]
MRTVRSLQLASLVLVVLLSGCQAIHQKPMPIAPTMQLDKIRIRNYLSQCLTIKPLGVRHTTENVTLLTQMVASQDLSQCQCNSVYVEYLVEERVPIQQKARGKAKLVNWGKGYFIAPVPKFQSKPQLLTLKHDTALQYQGPLVISLRCKDEKPL